MSIPIKVSVKLTHTKHRYPWVSDANTPNDKLLNIRGAKYMRVSKLSRNGAFVNFHTDNAVPLKGVPVEEGSAVQIPSICTVCEFWAATIEHREDGISEGESIEFEAEFT
jgi:hypothetical protein